jgi:hypothetical protein
MGSSTGNFSRNGFQHKELRAMALTSQGKSPPTPGADDVGLIRKSTKLARSGMLRSGLRQGFLCCDLDGAQAHWLEIGCGMKRLMLLTGALVFVSSTARTQQVDIANDTELRVGYCLGFTEQSPI